MWVHVMQALRLHHEAERLELYPSPRPQLMPDRFAADPTFTVSREHGLVRVHEIPAEPEADPEPAPVPAPEEPKRRKR